MAEGTQQAGIGFSVHTGWAAAVAVGGSPGAPVVLRRARLELLRPGDGVSRFVYHSVEKAPLEEAKQVVRRAEQASRRNARAELERFAAEVKEVEGHRVVAAGLAAAAGKVPEALEAVLRSHALIHSAEGELFRGALANACEALELQVQRVPRKALYARAGEVAGKTEAAVKKVVDGAGKGLGPPWGADQKEAMALAWIALASARRR